MRLHRSRYLEKLVTRDEQAVAFLLENIEQSFAKKDREKLLSIFSEEAMITVFGKSNGFFDKTAYGKELGHIFATLRRIRFFDVFIRIIGSEAKISCVSDMIFEGGMRKYVIRYFVCKKIDNHWFIVRADISG